MRKNFKLNTLTILLLTCHSLINAQERSLERSLLEIDVQRAGENTDTEKLTSECLKLIQEFNSPEEMGKIYTEIAVIYSQNGMKDPDKTVEYCEKALKYPIDLETACQMYVFWGDALQFKYWNLRGEEFTFARQQILQSCLKGLKIIWDNKIPKERQRLTAVNIIDFDGPLNDPFYKELLEKHKQEIEVRKKIDLQNKLIQHRDALIEKCAFLYSNTSNDLIELRQLSERILQNSNAVDELIDSVKVKIKQIKE